MKKMILIIAVLATGIGITRWVQLDRPCASQKQAAASAWAKKYYAIVLTELAPYFARETCHASDDVEALNWALQARLRVPQADFGDIVGAEQLIRLLARKGDTSARIRLARLAIRDGELARARRLLKDIDTAEATLMHASLGDIPPERMDQLIQAPGSDTKPLFRTMAYHLASKGQETETLSTDTAIPTELQNVSQSLVTNRYPRGFRENLAVVARSLSIEEATLMSGLLLRVNRLEDAVLSLDRVAVPLNDLLLDRLSLALFKLGRYGRLTAETLGKRPRIQWPERTLVLSALAGLIENGQSGVTFNLSDQIKRIGAEAATSWHALFTALRSSPLDPKKTLDALSGIAPFARGFGVFSRLEADILRLYGQDRLARRAADFASILGFDKPLNIRIRRPEVFETIQQELMIAPRASPALVTRTQSISPPQISLARMATARELLMDGSQEASGEALFILRGVLAGDPQNGAAHTMMAHGLVRFNDWPRAMNHLSAAVDADPDETPRILRQILWFYADQGAIQSKVVVNAWASLTRLEAKRRGVAFNHILHDRLMLLAQYAEEKGDTDLALHTYERALDHYPDHAIAMNNLAMIALAHGDLDRAAALASSANSLAPGTPAFEDTLAQVTAAATPGAP